MGINGLLSLSFLVELYRFMRSYRTLETREDNGRNPGGEWILFKATQLGQGNKASRRLKITC